MAIHFKGRIHWRKTAPYHLQLELDQKAIQLELAKEYQHWDGSRIECRVVRLFRSNKGLTIDDRVSFRIFVCEPGLEPTGPAYIYKKDSSSDHLYGGIPPRRAARLPTRRLRVRNPEKRPYQKASHERRPPQEKDEKMVGSLENLNTPQTSLEMSSPKPTPKHLQNIHPKRNKKSQNLA